MKKINLNGKWQMKSTSDEQWINADVPGTVFGALLDAGKVPDPYYRDNEDKIDSVFDADYEYSRDFIINQDFLSHDQVRLCCEGLDTICSISINGKKLADTNNMHRTYRFDVKEILTIGTNTIHILFHSPKEYTKQMAKKHPSVGLMGGKGTEYIRKAQCMYGWDWGLSLPDSGIWRDIYIECFDVGKIKDFHILQSHEQGLVELDIDIDCSVWNDDGLSLIVDIVSPSGQKISTHGRVSASSNICHVSIKITDPQLWWPRGFGEQSLYEVNIGLLNGEKKIDSRNQKIGLRTIRLRREDDEYGKSYEFVVNGKAIFIKGSNLIIEDALLGRRSRERTEKMIKSCVEANFNCIRVWGGAYYPDDYFYDLCDQYGIVLFHDLMFACFFYPADDAFIENVSGEITDNVKRVRNHACIGLWCGNNEIEILHQLTVSDNPKIVAMRKKLGMQDLEIELKNQLFRDYQKLFCNKLPALISKIDPQTNYVPTSPLVPDSENLPDSESLLGGSLTTDSHYYLAYDNLSPYSSFREKQFRFVSEMGFQSYPNMKTIYSFTEAEDRKSDSKVMLNHQKCSNGNQIIEAYMGQDYPIPEDFKLYVYESQLIAGEIQRYEIEHLRRDMGICMGVITWQLNDCWPAVSWAGLDYFGRWKAQQYYTKRFYAPVLVSAREDGTKIDLWITNDTLENINGKIFWKLMDSSSHVIEHQNLSVSIDTCSAREVVNLDFDSRIKDKKELYVEYGLIINEEIVSSGTVLFVKPKDFHFEDPRINLEFSENERQFIIILETSAFAKSIALDLKAADCIFSDNYFDLSANSQKIVQVDKTSLSEKLTIDDFTQQLEVMSVFDLKR